MAGARVDSLGEIPSMKYYRLNITIKYVNQTVHTDYGGEACDLETYMKWNYVLNNPTMFQTKQDNLLRKECRRWLKIEQIDKGRSVVIYIAEPPFLAPTKNVRERVTKEILSDTDSLHINSISTDGVDTDAVSRHMMEISANLLRHQLLCLSDASKKLIYYVCPRTMLREVEGVIKTVFDDVKARGLLYTKSYSVPDHSVLRSLCNSAQLEILASEHEVVLELMKGPFAGFFIKGKQQSGINVVGERLTKMISEIKTSRGRSHQTKQWSLSCGHQIIVHPSMYLHDAVDNVVLVQEGPLAQANYDKQFKLILPQWSDEKGKEVKTGIERCLDDFISHCQRNRLMAVKLEMPTLSRKVKQWFTVFLFEILSGRGAKWSPPFKLYVCTDDIELYHQTAELCDAMIKRGGGMDMSGHFKEGPSTDVENSSEALPSLDITQASDNVEDTASENNPGPSTDVEHSSEALPSLDITQASDNVEDTASENNTDTDSSDDEGTGLEVCLIMDFQRYERGRRPREQRTADAGAPCDFETYMKWNYVLNNPTMFQTKQYNIRKLCRRRLKIEQIDKNKGLVIDFGNVALMFFSFNIRNQVTNLRPKVMEEILSDTDALRINSFQTGGVDKTEVSRQMMEKSANLLQHQLWCFADENKELIHYVCPRSRLEEGDRMIKTVVDGFKAQGLLYTKSYFVPDNFVLRSLCNSAELKILASEHDVVLELTKGQFAGFLVKGNQSGIDVVGERLTKMVSENKTIEGRSHQTKQWSLSPGHQIIVHSSVYLHDVIDHVVLVQEGPFPQANYDRQFKLILPQWSDEKGKEVKTGIERCLDEFISHCQRIKWMTVKLEIPTLSRKVTQWFTVFLFELLSRSGAQLGPPSKLYLCTDDIDVYHQTVELCDANIQRVWGMDMSGQFKEGPITDVEHSSEALPSLDNVSDNVEDTASENNKDTGTVDNVGATTSDIDTDSSDDEGTGLEVCLIVDFQRKVNGKLQDFVRPLEITLSPENFLKWQFICANQQALDQRIDKVRGNFENIVYDDGTLKISLGKQKRNPDLDELANKIHTVFLENTDSLIINWFPTDMQIDTSVAASELDKVLQKSDLWNNNDIFTYTTNCGQIRLVFDAKHQKTVGDLMQTTFQGCCVELMPKNSHAKIDLPVVYDQVLHQKNIVTKVESKFPDVSMMYDISYSSNQYTLKLAGPDPAVGQAEKWAKDNFVNVYISDKVKFTDVDNWLGQLDISTLIKEQLLNKCPSDVFWMIHKPTQTVWICSSDRGSLQDTVTEVRTCLKQRHIVMERDEISMDAIEKMLVWIGGMEDILNRKVAVNVFTDNRGWNVCITGGRLYVESFASRIKQFVNEETSISALVDTDDNGENAAVDIVHEA